MEVKFVHKKLRKLTSHYSVHIPDLQATHNQL